MRKVEYLKNKIYWAWGDWVRNRMNARRSNIFHLLIFATRSRLLKLLCVVLNSWNSWNSQITSTPKGGWFSFEILLSRGLIRVSSRKTKSLPLLEDCNIMNLQLVPWAISSTMLDQSSTMHKKNKDQACIFNQPGSILLTRFWVYNYKQPAPILN